MSLSVSYKKQVILGILSLIILLTIIEVFANIWLYNFYHCDFEDNELFKNQDPEIKRKLCLDNIGLELNTQRVSYIAETHPGTRDFDKNLVKFNSERFRGPEFQKDKPENTFRIFVLGGSTTFGAGVLDNQTYPYYLQELYDNASLPFKIEVINTGWAGFWSLVEVKLIKERLIDFDPDLFIVYDGWNDEAQQNKFENQLSSPTLWKERWMEICDLGKQHGFDTVITLQPMVNTGEKKLSAQEQINFMKIEEEKLFENYPEYVEKMNELRDHCTLTADLRGLFDNYEEPIYFDIGHTGPKGNQIIAEKFYQISFPIVMEGSRKIGFDKDEVPHLKLETDQPPVSRDLDYFIEESFFVLRDIISLYKTPKVLHLIFEE